jgi:hypothetical protein
LEKDKPSPAKIYRYLKTLRNLFRIPAPASQRSDATPHFLILTLTRPARDFIYRSGNRWFGRTGISAILKLISGGSS